MEGNELLNYTEKYFYILAAREESYKVIDYFNEEINKKNKQDSGVMECLFFQFFPFLERISFWGNMIAYSNLILKINSHFQQKLLPYSNIISQITGIDFVEIINGEEREDFEFEWEIPSKGDIPSLEYYSEIINLSSILKKEFINYFIKNIKEYPIDIRKKIIRIALQIINYRFIMEKIRIKMYGKHFIKQYIYSPKKNIGFKRCIHGKNKYIPCIQCRFS